MKINVWVWIGVALFGAAFLLGCDDKPSTSGLDDAFLDGPATGADPRTNNITALLSVTPANIMVSQVSQQFAFKALGGVAPYRWELAERDVGRLRVEGANAAVYEVLALARNSVIVYDQLGHAAVAQVMLGDQMALTVAANPSTLNHNDNRSLLTASGGRPPYYWTVSDITLGRLNQNTGTQVTYTRTFRGDNAVTVTDGAGNTATVIIFQP